MKDTKFRKRSVKEIKEVLPDASIRAAFMEREDIKKLSKAKREDAWKKHQVSLNSFFNWMSKCDSVVVPS